MKLPVGLAGMGHVDSRWRVARVEHMADASDRLSFSRIWPPEPGDFPHGAPRSAEVGVSAAGMSMVFGILLRRRSNFADVFQPLLGNTSDDRVHLSTCRLADKL